MKNKLLTFGILAVVLAGISAPRITVAQTIKVTTDPLGGKTVGCPEGQRLVPGNPPTCQPVGSTSSPQPTSASDLAGSVVKDITFGIFGPLIKGTGYVLMTLSAGVLTLVGSLFDFTVDFTIVKMAQNIGNPEGVGGSISLAWSTLRDIANMFFIFVLLFAAFRAMFSLNFGNVGKTIGNIILIALLINFSLFFSKVVIDASNVVAIGFYNSIVNSNTSTQPTTEAGTVADTGQKTITSGYMRMLGLQSWYSANILTSDLSADRVLVIGVMGSIFMLVTAVIFLITAVMFLARFIILIFLMILSPLAFIAYIVPGMQGRFHEWWKALIDQAFFAPVFFALTWVVFKLGSAKSFLGVGNAFSGAGSALSDAVNKAPTLSSMGLVFNYVIILGFAVTALVVAKKMATSGATALAFKSIAGGIGAVGVGGAALVGRQTVGRAAGRLEKSQRFQRLAASNPKTFGALYSGTKKAARGSFDLRQSDTLKKAPVVGKELDILGTSSRGQGGFEKYREEKTKEVIEKGKQFTDRQARVDYAKRVASKIGTYRGSVPNNIPSLFGTMGRSNRIAAATLFDDRIKELRTEIGTARGEVNTYRNTMGIASTPGVAPTAAQLALLSPYEQSRYNLLTDPSITRNGSMANLNNELTNLQGDRTSYGLDNTLKQQF